MIITNSPPPTKREALTMSETTTPTDANHEGARKSAQ